LTALFARD
ncbi:hypothetical protein D018_4292B, partial [Vibrio parahaemolyticus VP2007-007]